MDKNERLPVSDNISPFERIRHVHTGGGELWRIADSRYMRVQKAVAVAAGKSSAGVAQWGICEANSIRTPEKRLMPS